MDTPTTTEPPAGDPASSGPAPDSGQTGPRVSSEEVRDLGRLRRSREDRKIAGVAGGLARHLDIDPIILRVAFVVLVFFGGAGLLMYGALWLLVPEDGDQHAKLHLDPRNRTAAIVVAGVLATLALIGDSVGGYDFPWPILIIGGIVALVLSSRDRRRDHRPEYAVTGAHAAAEPGDPVSYQGYVPPTPRPSKRELYGPSLFLPTLAVIAIALGALRLYGLSGHGIPGAAYPALALAICGAALVIGAWAGRAGSVLWIAFFAGMSLCAATIDGGFGSSQNTPTSVSQLQPTYAIGIGELVLDLRQLEDPAALDGRTIVLSGDIGQIDVIVPDNIDVTAVGDIDGGGQITIFGETDDGDSPHLQVDHDATEAVAHVTIEADLRFGDITMNLEEAR